MLNQGKGTVWEYFNQVFLISTFDQRQQHKSWLTTNIPTMPRPHLRQSHEKVSKMSCNVLGVGLIQTSNAHCSELLFAGIQRHLGARMVLCSDPHACPRRQYSTLAAH
jgi:hypothetical protein